MKKCVPVCVCVACIKVEKLLLNFLSTSLPLNMLAHTRKARLDILRIHSRKMNLTRGINLRKIAETMPGASGAEIKVLFVLS